MKRLFMLLCFVSLLAASTARAAAPLPVLITEPDCPDGFTMDLRPRSNPNTLGTLTWDGYPVLLERSGAVRYVIPHGDRLPDPLPFPNPSGS